MSTEFSRDCPTLGMVESIAEKGTLFGAALRAECGHPAAGEDGDALPIELQIMRKMLAQPLREC